MVRLVVLLMLTLVVSCSEDKASEAPPPTREELPEIPPEVPDEPQDDPPSFTETQLDEMDRPALEAACYAGSSAACDRLGH